MKRKLALALMGAAFVLPVAAVLSSDEAVDLTMVTRIRDEGFNNSKVMETLAQLTDVLGPRLTGSPQLKKANEWTRDQLATWGLTNAHLEPWGPFGRGWSLERVSVHVVSPVTMPVIAVPKAWTSGTQGVVRGKAIRVRFDSEADMEKEKGKLAGAIVFLNDPVDLRAPERAAFNRFSEQELSDMSLFQVPGGRRPGAPAQAPPGGPGGPPDRETQQRRQRVQRAMRPFLIAEKVLATVEPSQRDGGIVLVGGGGSRQKDEDPGPPALVIAAEHYNRIARLIDRKMDVEMELDVRTKFYDDDPMAYNTVAEIAGTDKKLGTELVMVGAHLDSWHAGTGATDNAAGSAVAMEAVRILKALDVHPRRTIRIGLWTGEEQGLLGSRAYVKEHFAARPDPTPAQNAADRDTPAFMRQPTGPLTLKPEHVRFSAYFNLDNGTGKIRGVYTQQNAAAVPIFESWLRPFADLGATTVTNRNTGGTDHQSFDGVGLPGFQFIQDQADYETRTHHTNLDVYDRMQREDMMQASVIMASFLYNAAMREDRFPRKAMPRDPSPRPSQSPQAPTPTTTTTGGGSGRTSPNQQQ
jgi:carboxypeptidase Q